MTASVGEIESNVVLSEHDLNSTYDSPRSTRSVCLEDKEVMDNEYRESLQVKVIKHNTSITHTFPIKNTNENHDRPLNRENFGSKTIPSACNENFEYDKNSKSPISNSNVIDDDIPTPQQPMVLPTATMKTDRSQPHDMQIPTTATNATDITSTPHHGDEVNEKTDNNDNDKDLSPPPHANRLRANTSPGPNTVVDTSNVDAISTPTRRKRSFSSIFRTSNLSSNSLSSRTKLTTPELRRLISFRSLQARKLLYYHRDALLERHARRRAARAEAKRSKKSRIIIIPASHPCKIAWDVLTILLSIASAHATHASIRDRSTYDFTPSFIFMQVWFICDILLNFITEHSSADGKTVIRSSQAVWARYLTTWFVVDALSIIPWERLYVKPIIEMQNRRNFFTKSFFRTKAVVKVSRFLRNKHFVWFGKVADRTKDFGVGGRRLLGLIIKYVPKYLLFYRNMRGVLVLKTLRMVHFIRKVSKGLTLKYFPTSNKNHVDGEEEQEVTHARPRSDSLGTDSTSEYFSEEEADLLLLQNDLYEDVDRDAASISFFDSKDSLPHGVEEDKNGDFLVNNDAVAMMGNAENVLIMDNEQNVENDRELLFLEENLYKGTAGMAGVEGKEYMVGLNDTAVACSSKSVGANGDEDEMDTDIWIGR